MALIKVEGVTHWSIPVNDLEESEKFYSEILGLENRGRYIGRIYAHRRSCPLLPAGAG